jgi:hypothetical protein
MTSALGSETGLGRTPSRKVWKNLLPNVRYSSVAAKVITPLAVILRSLPKPKPKAAGSRQHKARTD